MKEKLTIMKIGGSCLTEASSLKKLINIVKSHDDSNIIFVASGFSGVTDKLIALAKTASKGTGDYKELLLEIRQIHEHINESLFANQIIHLENTADFINTCMRNLEEICEHICDYGLEKFRLDYTMSAGEKLSTFMMAEYLDAQGFDSVYIPADQLIVTDDRFGNALPLIDYTIRKVKRQITQIINRDAIPCITGFIGFNKQGYTTTLGRGGSDFTATIIARCLAELYKDKEIKVILWKNVDGILSASPKFVKEPKLLEKLTYAEAKEIAYFGAKVLHPKCISPLESVKVPLEIRNIDKPITSPFTLIDEIGNDEKVIKGVSILNDVALITAKSSSLVAIPGTLANIFSTLGGNDINVSLVSQSSSEVNTTFCVSKEDGKKTIKILKESPLFKEWFDFFLNENVVVLGVIGHVHEPCVKKQIFEKLSERNIEVIAVAQSADGLNVSLVLDETIALDAINAIHEAFKF
ncbi:MAG: aspartate kinase [Promethearchaeota archaeon]